MVAYKKYCIRMVLSCQGVQTQVVIIVKDKVTEIFWIVSNLLKIYWINGYNRFKFRI